MPVTHPPHPLFDQILEVAGLRREGGQTYCDVLLADGSRLRLPAHWTDHPAGGSRFSRADACTCTTPGALRELLWLLRAWAAAREGASLLQGLVLERAVRGPHASRDSRHLALTRIAIGRPQAQHALGAIPGSAESAPNRRHRP